MLTRDDAVELLSRYGGNAGWTRHCHAVAAAAARVGDALAEKRAIDRAFLWSGALLHDIGRHITHDPLGHGVEGYHLLSALGHAKEAHVCASHLLFGLDAAEASHVGLPARDFVPRSIEERLVPLVDYLIEYDRPTTLEKRFASLRERNGGNTFFLDRLERAQASAKRFMTQIEAEIGASVEGIVADQ